MMFLRILTALTLGLIVASGVEARPATVSDFAICNGEATAATGGAALPGPREPLRPAQSGTADPVVKQERGMATGTDSSGKIIAGGPDVLSEGMDATRAGDPAYASAYRECMTQRGVTARPAP